VSERLQKAWRALKPAMLLYGEIERVIVFSGVGSPEFLAIARQMAAAWIAVVAALEGENHDG
jgi:hypothetical protein